MKVYKSLKIRIEISIQPLSYTLALTKRKNLNIITKPKQDLYTMNIYILDFIKPKIHLIILQSTIRVRKAIQKIIKKSKGDQLTKAKSIKFITDTQNSTLCEDIIK